MMLPPLSADLSLYKSSGHYRSSWSSSSTGAVVPQDYPWDCLECLVLTCAENGWCLECNLAVAAPPPFDIIAVIGCYLACCGATGAAECGGLC
jgi:hypothetical protein